MGSCSKAQHILLTGILQRKLLSFEEGGRIVAFVNIQFLDGVKRDEKVERMDENDQERER